MGPVAARGTGDIGMLVGFGASVLVYAGARAVERRERAKGTKAGGADAGAGACAGVGAGADAGSAGTRGGKERAKRT